MRATRAFRLPKLDCGFVQLPMPCWCLISTSQGRQRRHSWLGQLEQHKMEHVMAPASSRPVLLWCMTGKQHHWAEHGQSIAPMPVLMLLTHHPNRGRCSVIQMSLQWPAACKWDPGELPSTRGAYAMISWWCKIQNLVRPHLGRTGEELFTVYFSLPFIRTVHWGDEHLHKFIWSVSTVLFLSFPIIYSWANVKTSVKKQLMFTANCSCSVLREKQHSWQNNLPLGPDLNPRKARETFPCFLVQAILILSIFWTSYTLVKIGWTCWQRHRKKWKIFAGLLISFGQKSLR